MTLAERLRALYPEASGRSLKQWLAGGRVTVDGRPCRDARLVLPPGATVALGARAKAAPFPRELGRVHEDEAMLVVVKPAGLLTIATERERERTAYRLLWDYLAARGERPFIVHRLDRETSGLLVFARTEAAKRALQAQFEARSVERVYRALVAGRPAREEGTLESRLAITRYRVVTARRGESLLELTLGTGRRHQIRVQLAEAGWPIVGDVTHGGPRGDAGRICLHATRLAFAHPTTGARVAFESAAPADWV